jgi:hypothetical protein
MNHWSLEVEALTASRFVFICRLFDSNWLYIGANSATLSSTRIAGRFPAATGGRNTDSGGGRQVAEMGMAWIGNPEKHPSGAKAWVHFDLFDVRAKQAAKNSGSG